MNGLEAVSSEHSTNQLWKAGDVKSGRKRADLLSLKVGAITPTEACLLDGFIELLLVGPFALQRVLAPPVNTRFQCQEQLVANLRC